MLVQGRRTEVQVDALMRLLNRDLYIRGQEQLGGRNLTGYSFRIYSQKITTPESFIASFFTK